VETILRKNKATNPTCIHCSGVGFFQLLEDLILCDRLGRLRSRNTAENRIDPQSPRLK